MMTNAEVFIGDEELIDTFKKEFCDFAYKENGEYEYCGLPETLEAFFKKERKPKPTLTEDERVILRNIDKKFTKICRDYGNNICFIFEGILKEPSTYYANIFGNLFQFIKERRRILN